VPEFWKNTVVRHEFEVGRKRVMGTGRDGNCKDLKCKMLRGRAGREYVRKCAVHGVECHGDKIYQIVRGVGQ
jgi:hypothetical protein